MADQTNSTTAPAPDVVLAPGRRGLLGGAAALLAGAAAAALPCAVHAAGAGPDAELIRLCAEHVANLHAYNASTSMLEAGDDPLRQAYERTLDAIHDAEPHTVDGMLAKARAAKAEALGPDGSDSPDYCAAGQWAWDLVNDLLRLKGAVA